MSTKRFRIAFSFAGEKRDFVEQVAALLARQFGEEAILYDKYHESEFARYDLGIYLPKLYGEQSDLIVPVFCPDYDSKRWTGWEWVHIYSLLTKADGYRVMPSRFDYAKADGMSLASGFIELDNKTPQQFVTLILERLALNEGNLKDHYIKPTAVDTFPPRTSIPHNLPSLRPFFGREDELRKIADALDPASRTWGALIDGPGGMGKTSLAVRAAYDAPPEVFRKIIFISLKARELDDDGVRDLSGFLISGLAELLGELARELSRDDIVKFAEDQRPRLLLDALRDKQTLLVLDNLESLLKRDRDTLFTFVKKLPAGCKAILTSRGRIGSGAEELILEKLDERAALATLAELATHNPHLAKTNDVERLGLYRETGGSPLLLCWTAGQIGRGHCLTFTDALEFLRSCPPGNDPLEFVFGDLVEDFKEAEILALCALTYFAQPAKVEHIAAISGLSEQEIDRALRSLANRSLAIPSDELTTYALVPMVANFLRKKKPEVVADTGKRLEARAYELILENGGQVHARFPALEAAWPGIAPAIPLFLVGPNQRLQTVCVALQSFLVFQGRLDEWIALSEKAESRAEEASDYLMAGWRAFDSGCVHRERQQADAVLACAQRADIHWSKANAGARELAVVSDLRGMGHLLKGDVPRAFATFKTALGLFRSIATESADVASCLNLLGQVEIMCGHIPAARVHFREALRVSRAIGSATQELFSIGNQASLELDCRDWPTAEALAREALSLSETIHRHESIALNNYRIATALVHQGKSVDALPYARRAVEVFTHLGSSRLEVALATLAKCGG